MAEINKPGIVEWNNFSFVIMDSPNNVNLHMYIKELKKYNVTDLVRACEETYCKDPVEAAGIRFHELKFPDGEPPDSHVIDTWLDLLMEYSQDNREGRSIAVHCVAGLGRAPVLVAIALIEHGVDAINAVELIRKHRRGAINLRQLKYLQKYEPRRGGKNKCIVM